VGVGLFVGEGLAAIIGGQKVLSSKSEEEGLSGQGCASFEDGAEAASKHPPLIKNPFSVVTVKSKSREAVAKLLTLKLVFVFLSTALSITYVINVVRS